MGGGGLGTLHNPPQGAEEGGGDCEELADRETGDRRRVERPAKYGWKLCEQVYCSETQAVTKTD
jgi:hypothetical protein